MKVIFYLILGVLIASCGIEKLHSKQSNDFTILLGSGFKNDTVSLSINNVEIFKNNVLQSDTTIGIVRTISISKKRNNISLLNSQNESVTNIDFNNSRQIVIDIKINQKLHKLDIYLKKGYIIMINNQSFYNKVDLFQSKKTIALY